MGMSIEEAAEMTGIGRNTMRKLVEWGKLPVLKVGRKTIIRRDSLETFMTVNKGRNLLNQADNMEINLRFYIKCHVVPVDVSFISTLINFSSSRISSALL